jgi:hypothetical protein
MPELLRSALVYKTPLLAPVFAELQSFDDLSGVEFSSTSCKSKSRLSPNPEQRCHCVVAVMLLI